MKVQFVAGVTPIIDDAASALDFWRDKLSLPFAPVEEGSDYSVAEIDGLKHFGLWTLADAARSTFGRDQWPADVPRPQATIELEVDDVAAAVAELRSNGVRILQDTKTEEWGQTTARLLSPEGLLIGITYTPHLCGEVTS